MMNQGILNSEVLDCADSRSSLKVTASRSFGPSGGIQVLNFGDHFLVGQNWVNWLEPISLRRETGFSSTVPRIGKREGSGGFSLLFLLLILLFPSSIEAQNLDADLSGYVKELGSISLSNDLKTIRYDNILHHRIESEFDFGEHFEFRADVRTRLFNGWTVNNTPAYGDFLENDPGYFDLSHTWIDGDHTVLNSAIDRLHVSYFKGPWEVHLGRQRINWGKTMVWNPNDLFNAYAYLDFDYEERPGTDALYASYSWSYASSIEAGYRLGKSLDESVIAGMFRGNLGEYDIQLIAGNYLQELAIGAGWSGYLSTAGFKGEVSYFHPRENFLDESGHLTASLGGDYMFSNGVYVSSELLYNGGWNESANPLGQLTRPPSASDLFIAETGYFVNTSFQLNPLTSLSGGLMGSFDRKMLIIIPQFTRSLTENIDFLILAQLLKGSVFSDLTETPNLFFFRLKYSY